MRRFAKFIAFVLPALILIPGVVLAADPIHSGVSTGGYSDPSYGGGGTLFTVVSVIGVLVSWLVPIASSLALLAFFWGLAMYLFNFGEGKEDKQKQGRNLMVYGVIAIFVMVSIFGITELLRRSFGINDVGGLQAPYVEGTPR